MSKAPPTDMKRVQSPQLNLMTSFVGVKPQFTINPGSKMFGRFRRFGHFLFSEHYNGFILLLSLICVQAA